MVSDPGFVLPGPWERKQRDSRKETLISPHQKGSFVHLQLKGQDFHFHVPISTSYSPIRPEKWLPLLHFNTKRCAVSLGSSLKRYDIYKGASELLIIELQNSNGVRIGIIDSLFGSESEYDQGPQIELIAISEGCGERTANLDAEPPRVP
jgi:hypothetical protein